MRAWLIAPVLAAGLFLVHGAVQAQVPTGDVLVTGVSAGRVYRLDPTAPGPIAPELVPTGPAFTSPRGLAVDRNGLLLVTDNGPKTLLRVDPARDLSGLAAQFSTLSTNLRGVVEASDGRVFVVDPGIVPLVEPPLPPIRGVTYFPLVTEVDVVDGFVNGEAVAGCATVDPALPGIARCGDLYFPSGIAIESEVPELALLVADAGDPAPSGVGRVNQGVIRVFPDQTFAPPDETADELFCAPGPFATPRSLAVDRSPGREGTVLVTDSGDAALGVPARVFRVAASGCNDPEDPSVETVAEGSGLVRPVGIAVADDGTIFVADATADTVFRIDPDTGSVTPLSTPGSIDQAWELQIQRTRPGPYLVADASVPAVLAVDPAAPARSTVTSGGSLVEPAAFELLPGLGGVVLADPGAQAVTESTLAGAQTVVSQGGRLAAPTSASREAGGTYLVTDLGDPGAVPPLAPAVIRVEPSQPSPGNQTVVSEGGKLVHPVAGAVDASGFLIVADAGAGTAQDPPRILRITPQDGLGSAGQATLFEGPPLFAPRALALDDAGGTILLADGGDASNPPSVLRLVRSADPPGEILTITALGLGGLLETPAGIALDTDGSILVTDAGAPSTADDGAVVRVDALSGLQSGVPSAGALDEPSGIGVRAPEPGPYVDQDGDGLADGEDNCISVENADQRDTDDDRIGNVCDPDYDDNGVVGTSDFLALRAAFGTAENEPGYDPDIDVDGDGNIGTPEFVFLRSCFGTSPGASGRLGVDAGRAYCRASLSSP